MLINVFHLQIHVRNVRIHENVGKAVVAMFIVEIHVHVMQSDKRKPSMAHMGCCIGTWKICMH